MEKNALEQYLIIGFGYVIPCPNGFHLKWK